mgnify:CR=1 FL=1
MIDGPGVVLDASALLAALHSEKGGKEVEATLDKAALSSVNLAEVLQKGLGRGIAVEGIAEELLDLGVTVFPFTVEDAEVSARLWPGTKSLGLSLGDRACLALALSLGLPALTADGAWRQLTVGVEVRVIR